MKRIFFSIVFISLFFIQQITPVHSANFRLSFDTQITFNDEGEANVLKNVTITNLTTSSYPSTYFLDIPIDALDIVAFDSAGKLETDIIQENGQTRVKIPVNKAVLGEGQNAKFALTYKTKSLATKTNEMWNIVIPGYTSNENISLYQIQLITPASWGSISKSVPPPESNQTWILTTLPDREIRVDFGTPYTKLPSEPAQKFSQLILLVSGVSFGIVVVYIVFKITKKIA